MDMSAFLRGEIPEAVEGSRAFARLVQLFCLLSLGFVTGFLELKNLLGLVGYCI